MVYKDMVLAINGGSLDAFAIQSCPRPGSMDTYRTGTFPSSVISYINYNLLMSTQPFAGAATATTYVQLRVSGSWTTVYTHSQSGYDPSHSYDYSTGTSLNNGGAGWSNVTGIRFRMTASNTSDAVTNIYPYSLDAWSPLALAEFSQSTIIG